MFSFLVVFPAGPGTLKLEPMKLDLDELTDLAVSCYPQDYIEKDADGRPSEVRSPWLWWRIEVKGQTFYNGPTQPLLTGLAVYPSKH